MLRTLRNTIRSPRSSRPSNPFEEGKKKGVVGSPEKSMKKKKDATPGVTLDRRPRGALESASLSPSLLQSTTKRKTRGTCIDHDAVSGSRVPRPSATGHLPPLLGHDDGGGGNSPHSCPLSLTHSLLFVPLIYYESPESDVLARSQLAGLLVASRPSRRASPPPSPSRYSSPGACDSTRATVALRSAWLLEFHEPHWVQIKRTREEILVKKSAEREEKRKSCLINHAYFKKINN